MNEAALLAPRRFRFTESDDVKQYGDRWYVYDESQIMRLPARRLIQLEGQLGMPLVHVMNSVRSDSVTGNLAAEWLAVHLVEPEIAGDFEQFSPAVMLTEWETVPDETNAMAAAPLDPTHTVDSPTAPPLE